MMVRLSSDYSGSITASSLSGLTELSLCLRRHRDGLVLVGGWVPFFLLKEHQRKNCGHIGSIDIDFVVDPAIIDEEEYATIVEILKDRGWEQKSNSRFSYVKTIESPVDESPQIIQVDFLTLESSDTDVGHRHRSIQRDLLARTMKGAPLALTHKTELRFTGQLPGNGESDTEIQMADIVGCIGMKGLALGERYKEKDAYDLFLLIENYENGPRDVATAVKPFLGDALLHEGIDQIQKRFRNEKAEGPSWVANFLTEKRDDEHQRYRIRAFHIVNDFIESINDEL